MGKIDWELRDGARGSVVIRLDTPFSLWLLDRWFRVPDLLFDRLEWWFPRTAPVTRVPCLLYSRWLPWLVEHREFTEYDAVERKVEERPA